MENLYKYLNEVDTDFSEYEEEPLSPEEISKINSRINKKINRKKKNSNKTLTWVGRAAAITLCCLAVGGGVYAATTLRKNTADNLRIKSSESETISEDGNKVTKKIYDEETGSELVYEVYTDGASETDASGFIEQINKAGVGNAEIRRISKQDTFIKIDVNFELDDISKFEPLRENFDHFVDQGNCVAINQETFDNFSLISKLDDTEMLSWVNNYNIDGNNLSIEIFIDTLTTKALNDGTDPNWHDVEYDPVLGPDSLSEEDAQFEAEYFENYYTSLPDPLNSTISFDLFLGNDLGGTYTFVTKLDGNYENGENERYSIDGGSAEIEWYGQKNSLSIDSYSIEANGLQFYGSYLKTEEYDAYEAEREKQGVFSYEEELRIRAWDDLGNYYLLIPEPGVCSVPDSETGTLTYDASEYVAKLCDEAGNLAWQNEKSDIKYSSEWADGISQITFAIERFTRTEDGTTRKVTITTELVSDPVTIDVK